MSSRSIGVTKVWLIRWMISWVIRSPSCSQMRISRTKSALSGYSISISLSSAAARTILPAASSKRSKNSRSRGTKTCERRAKRRHLSTSAIHGTLTSASPDRYRRQRFEADLVRHETPTAPAPGSEGVRPPLCRLPQRDQRRPAGDAAGNAFPPPLRHLQDADRPLQPLAELARLGDLDWALLRRAHAQRVPERVTQAAVSAVEALRRLLRELDAVREEVLVRLVDVVDRDDRRRPQRALGDELADLLRRRLVVCGRPGLLEEQLLIGLPGEVHGEPAHEAEVGIGVHLEAELPNVEVERLVLIEYVNLCMSDFVSHGDDATPRSAPSLLQNCSVWSRPSRSTPAPPSGRRRASGRCSAARRRSP